MNRDTSRTGNYESANPFPQSMLAMGFTKLTRTFYGILSYQGGVPRAKSARKL